MVGLVWRFGWAAQPDGLKFEARDHAVGTGAMHTVERSAYPLYRGTCTTSSPLLEAGRWASSLTVLTLAGYILSIALIVNHVPSRIVAVVGFLMSFVGLVIGLGTDSFTDEMGVVGFIDEGISAAAFGYSITQLVIASRGR